jgi:hypothetical protein
MKALFRRAEIVQAQAKAPGLKKMNAPSAGDNAAPSVSQAARGNSILLRKG